MNWDGAVACALALPGAGLAAHYGQPAVKANGNAFLNVGHEPDTSFVLALDNDLIVMLMETHPETFWKTPHYEGYPAVLVRYDSPDEDMVREMIARAYRRALDRPPPKPRRKT